jgi:hypothetical protein
MIHFLDLNSLFFGDRAIDSIVLLNDPSQISRIRRAPSPMIDLHSHRRLTHESSPAGPLLQLFHSRPFSKLIRIKQRC